MRILHLSESIDPATGGPANSVTSLAAAQAELGHDVALLCYAERQFERHLQQLSEARPSFGRVRVIAVPDGGMPERLLARAARAEMRSAVTWADTTHVHGVWKPFNAAAAQETIAQRRALVIAPRGMLDPWSLGQHRWRKRMALSLVWRKLLDAAHFMHALNADEQRGIAALGLRSRIEVFGNGVFPDTFASLPNGSAFRTSQPSLGDAPYILFLSRLHHKKGLDHLIPAYERFCAGDERTHLVIAGPDEGVRAYVEREILARGLSRRVHLVGPLHGRDKWSALAGASCFCLPSRQEGFSMAIAEALGCGIPVVISSGCHFPEVEPAGAGLVVALEAEQIAAALLRVVRDADWRARASAAGRQLMMSRYDWRAIAAGLVRAYGRADAKSDRVADSAEYAYRSSWDSNVTEK